MGRNWPVPYGVRAPTMRQVGIATTIPASPAQAAASARLLRRENRADNVSSRASDDVRRITCRCKAAAKAWTRERGRCRRGSAHCRICRRSPRRRRPCAVLPAGRSCAPVDASRPPTRAVLLGVQLPGVSDAEHASSLAELERLARTLGLAVIARVAQRRTRLALAAVVGAGKLRELARWTGGSGVVPVGPPRPRRGG